MMSVNHQTMYCEECKKDNIKASSKKYSDKTQKTITNNKEDSLKENFFEVTTSPQYLTPLGFNNVSNYTYNAYQNFHRKPWLSIVEEYGKYDELIDYVVNELNNYYNSTGKQGFRGFANNHKLIGQQLLKTIGYDFLREKIGVRVRRNSIEDINNEFSRLVDLFGRVPLYSEFMEHSKISIKSFVHQLKIGDSKKKYEKIVELLATKEDYEEYQKLRTKHKSNTGKDNHQGYKHDDEDLKINLEKIFNSYKESYGSYPSRSTFNKISPIDSTVYTHRSGKSWTDTCKELGFVIEGKINKSERIALGVVSDILDEEYEPQKTFKWLIGFKGFPLFCDGYFPKHNLIVEFDGEQHRNPIEWFGGIEVYHEIRTNDKYKEVLAERNGINLIRISSEEAFWDKDYIRQKLIKHGVTLNSAI